MGSSALILEDSATQLRIISTMLSRVGWTFVHAHEVQDALRIARTTPVGLMLLDVFVGQARSLTFIPEFRAAAPHTPIAIMTAGKHGVESAAEALAAARRARVEYLLPKPFGPQELHRVLDDAQKQQATERAPRVLIIDDSATIRSAIRSMLEPQGIKLLEACSMEEAMSRMDIVSIDALVTDIFMPGMGGIAGISKIRASWPDLPILAMTSGLEAQLEASAALKAAERVGASATLPKPFSAEALTAAVFGLLAQAEMQIAGGDKRASA